MYIGKQKDMKYPEVSLLAAYRHNDKEKKRDNNLTLEFVRDNIYKPCHYCGGFGKNGYNGLDRMDSSIGHIQSNCVPCCPTCNTKKNDMGYYLFYAKMRQKI